MGALDKICILLRMSCLFKELVEVRSVICEEIVQLLYSGGNIFPTIRSCWYLAEGQEWWVQAQQGQCRSQSE